MISAARCADVTYQEWEYKLTQHEPCWYAVRKGSTGHWSGDRKQTTLWQIDKPQKSETGHSTQKPVECMKRPIENNSSPGHAVYDPFVGSGTTIIAAEMTGRACHAIEISSAYCDVTITRWQNFTGFTAEFEATGRTFVETMADRQPFQPLKANVSGNGKARARSPAAWANGEDSPASRDDGRDRHYPVSYCSNHRH